MPLSEAIQDLEERQLVASLERKIEDQARALASSSAVITDLKERIEHITSQEHEKYRRLECLRLVAKLYSPGGKTAAAAIDIAKELLTWVNQTDTA